jgi:hypothetical protein
MPSREDVDELSAPPSRGGRRPLPPVGFWSYARRDDELARGKLSAVRALLMQELQQQYGRESIHLFQDMSTIEHGEDWERVIRAALSQSSFFIPIITPNFLQSEWCMREVQVFREREKELRALHPDLPERSRVFPIHFIDVEDVDPDEPEVLAFLQTLQWFDFRPFRHRSMDDMAMQEALANLAASMRKLLKHKVAWPDTSEAAAMTSDEAVRRAATLLVTSPGAEPSMPPAAPPAAAPPPLAPGRPIEIGDVLNHIFQVTRFIKAGGMGQVYEGLNINNGERVAIKVLLPTLASDSKITQLFHREAMTLTGLSHEALVQYRLLAKEPQLGVLYIVMAFIDGENLGDALDRIDRTPEAIAGLLRRLAGGLAAAHRAGAIHRDISLDNVMLPGGDLDRAKVIDFGIAKDAAGTLPTIIGDGFAGKLSFVAPEQLGAGGGKTGTWTDVYSLALVMLGVARGEKVAMGDNFAEAIACRATVPDLSAAPEALRPLFADMLAPDPAARLQTMKDVLAGLDAAMAPKPRRAAKRTAEPATELTALPADAPAAVAEVPEATVVQPARPPNGPAPTPAPADEAIADAPEAEAAPSRRTLWVAIGAAAAIGLLLLLVFVRPGGDSRPQPEPPRTVPAGPQPRAAPAAQPVDRSWLFGRRWCVVDRITGRLAIAAGGRPIEWTFRPAGGDRIRSTLLGEPRIATIRRTAPGMIEADIATFVRRSDGNAVTVREGQNSTELRPCP